ncbi:MAG TPA: YchJ family metal-binding protein [Kofleriaceae bacterium]
MKPASCPCGSGELAADCCDPILAGTPAATALALMRSRYTAYTRGLVDYLIATQDPETRAPNARAEIKKFTRQTIWFGLEIVAVESGGLDDATGIVEFVASGQIGLARDQTFRQHERSRFRRDDRGHWLYVDGDLE